MAAGRASAPFPAGAADWHLAAVPSRAPVVGPLPAGRGDGGAGAAPRIPWRLPLAFKPPREEPRGRGRGGPFPPAPRICQAPRGLVPQCLPATRKCFFHSVTFPRRSPSLRREASAPSRGGAEPSRRGLPQPPSAPTGSVRAGRGFYNFAIPLKALWKGA